MNQLNLFNPYKTPSPNSSMTYSAVHQWHLKNWPKTGTCEFCLLYVGKTRTDWASLDGSYEKGNREKWAELCRSCHKTYDYEHKIGPRLSQRKS